MSKEGKKTSFFMSAKASALLRRIAEHLGVSQTAVLEIIIREKAKQEGIPDEDQ